LPRSAASRAATTPGWSTGRHLCLLNNDTVVQHDGFEACVRFLDAHPDVGAVGPELLFPDGRKQNSIHNFPTVLLELVPRGVLEVLRPRRHPSKRYAHAGPVEVEAVLGACMVVRREALAKVGPMPEDYFFFLEETDWLFAMRAAGFRVVHLPEAKLVHVHGAGTKKVAPLATRIEYHRSLYHFFAKRRGPGAARAVAAIRIAKLAVGLVALAPLALVSARERERWRQRAWILAWHFAGRPVDWGLAGVQVRETGKRAGPAELGEGARHRRRGLHRLASRGRARRARSCGARARFARSAGARQRAERPAHLHPAAGLRSVTSEIGPPCAAPSGTSGRVPRGGRGRRRAVDVRDRALRLGERARRRRAARRIVERRAALRRVVVASSMSLYGEGAFRDADGATVFPRLRPRRSSSPRRRFELEDRRGRPLVPAPTPEASRCAATSVYAVASATTKALPLDQGRLRHPDRRAPLFQHLRYAPVALSNPYTGVIAIFSSRLLNRNRPVVFEDGGQSPRLRARLRHRRGEPARDGARRGGRRRLQRRHQLRDERPRHRALAGARGSA
jgi:GT2 family glycosyltransferase